MEYVSLSNSRLTQFLSDESNLRFGDGELENTETVYIYYTIIQYEYGE